MRPSIHEQGGSVLEPREFEPALDIFRDNLNKTQEPDAQHDISIIVTELEKAKAAKQLEHRLGASATNMLVEGLEQSDWSIHQSMLLDYRWYILGFSQRVAQTSTRA